MRVLKKIKQHKMAYIASDYWKPYESIIPKEKHIQILTPPKLGYLLM
jgi:IS1 family transposase